MRYALALGLLAALSTSCNETPSGLSTPVTVSGTIENLNGATIPANARVLVVWTVSATSPEYSYVFGSGTIDTGGSFSITFDGPPPSDALNAGQLGVGLVILTTDQSLGTGKVPVAIPFRDSSACRRTTP